MPNIELILQQYPRPYITDAEIAFFLKGTPNSIYSKVTRLIKQAKLIHIRRGLYTIGKNTGQTALPHEFELAQFIYGPSYISLESALSYHNLIPEAVYTTTSVTGKRTKNFNTQLGMFSFLHVPPENLYTHVELIKINNYKFFMAKPWKAICDYIFCYKKNWTSLEPLENSLRIDPKNLPVLTTEEIIILDEYYHCSRISKFLKNIQKNK